MNIICRPVRFFSIHPEYVAVILTSSTIAAFKISVYSPLYILLDATPAWYQAFRCLLRGLYFVRFLSSSLFVNKSL